MSNFKLVKQSYEIIEDKDPIDKIAMVAHNCYQVAEKDHKSNILFVKRLIDNKHYAMLEHFTFYTKLTDNQLDLLYQINTPFIKVYKNYISFSLRVLLELVDEINVSQKVKADRKNIKSKEHEKLILSLVSILPNEAKELIDLTNVTATELFKLELFDIDSCSYDVQKSLKVVSAKFITNRGVSHELVRHRLCSFAQESTRYCNYTKDKFSNSLTFIQPHNYELNKEVYDKYFTFEAQTYFNLIENGTIDDARNVLSNALKTSIIVTCTLEEWEHIFELRLAPQAHHDIRELLEPFKDYLYKNKLMK